MEDPLIIDLVFSFVNKLIVNESTLVKKKGTNRLGLLYFVFMDLYLEELDPLIQGEIYNSGLNSYWYRCLNTAIIGFYDLKRDKKLIDLMKFDILLPEWGLTAKIRTGKRGGRILRPWHGRLFINKAGHLQWERPESVIQL